MHKVRINFAVLLVIALIFLFVFVNILMSRNKMTENDYQNIVINGSFEQSLSEWMNINEGSGDLILSDVAQSAKYPLNPRYLNESLRFKYSPVKFSGNFSKSIIVFSFLNKTNNETNRITYVLNGTQDHGAYQNYAVNGIGYATKILNETIKISEENILNLNLLRDFNELAQQNGFPRADATTIHGVEFAFSTYSASPGEIEVRYDESFLDVVARIKKDAVGIVKVDEILSQSGSAIYSTNYLPTESANYTNLCSTANTNTSLEQSLKLEPSGKYLFLADIKIQTGRESPRLSIQTATGSNLLSVGANLYMAQTGWTTVGGIFDAESVEHKIILSVPNIANKLGYNCVNFDNIKIYKISMFEALFPKFLKLNLRIKTTDNLLDPLRVPYLELYSENFKNKLLNEYETKINVPIYDLYFDENTFWQSDVTHDYFDASFVDNNAVYKVKIKLRGDTIKHWGAPTKSWRVTFKNPGYFQGQKSINLIRPLGRGYVSDMFDYYLAKKLNLISLENKFVFLRINDKPYGLMYELEDWSADTLERNLRPVGNLYGEKNVEVEDSSSTNPTVYKRIFERTVLDWNKQVKNPYTSKSDYTDVFILSEALINADLSYYKTIIDVPKMLAWNIHSILTGSIHQDIIHNNRFYFNNTSGQFEFIPWDVGLDTETGQTGSIAYNPFVNLLLSDRKVFGDRNRLLFDYVNDNKNTTVDHFVYLDYYEQIKNQLFLLDHYDAGGYRLVDRAYVESEILKKNIKKQYAKVKKNFEVVGNLSAAFTSLPSVSADKKLFQVEIFSEDKNDFDLYEIQKIKSQDNALTIYHDNGDKKFSQDDLRVNPEKINYLLDSNFHYETYINTAPQTLEKKVFSEIFKTISPKEQNILSASYDFNSEKERYVIKSGINETNDSLTVIFRRGGIIPQYEAARYFIESSIDFSLQDIMAATNFEIVTNASKNIVRINKIAGRERDVILFDTAQSEKYPLSPEFWDTEAMILKYFPIKFIGEFSKSTVAFSFFNKNNKEIGRMTYVLNGTQDHGAYQNYAVDGVGYATKILSETIIPNYENGVKLNPLLDFNELAQKKDFSTIKKREVASVEFYFETSAVNADSVEVKYDESFLDFTKSAATQIKKTINYVPGKYARYVNLYDFSRVQYSKDEFLDKYPFFSESSDGYSIFTLKKGVYQIDDTIIIPENMPLKIEPGVNLRFSAQASLISYSAINAIGTISDKIVFTSSSERGDWGAVAIVRAKEKSYFSHCLFENGGDAYVNGIYFSGMLSIYHADAEIKQSEFRHASRKNGDDAVNLKNGLFAVENNLFFRNNFDALDIDFAEKKSYIRNNEFNGNGNDGIDISGSAEIDVTLNKIYKSGDKCISVGENSMVSVSFNFLDGCNFGIAVKDSSAVDFVDNNITKNNVGAAVYNKKEIFGGGSLNIVRANFVGNKMDFGSEIFTEDDLLKNTEQKRYESKCVIRDSLYATSRKEIKETIKEPKQKITSKKQLLKLNITDKLEDVGYEFAHLINFCEPLNSK